MGPHHTPGVKRVGGEQRDHSGPRQRTCVQQDEYGAVHGEKQLDREPLRRRPPNGDESDQRAEGSERDHHRVRMGSATDRAQHQAEQPGSESPDSDPHDLTLTHATASETALEPNRSKRKGHHNGWAPRDRTSLDQTDVVQTPSLACSA
jgi:hypothetical protein